MYPQKELELLQILVAKHGQYTIIKEVLFCSDITEYKLLENNEIEQLIDLLHDIYIENYNGEQE